MAPPDLHFFAFKNICSFTDRRSTLPTAEDKMAVFHRVCVTDLPSQSLVHWLTATRPSRLSFFALRLRLLKLWLSRVVPPTVCLSNLGHSRVRWVSGNTHWHHAAIHQPPKAHFLSPACPLFLFSVKINDIVTTTYRVMKSKLPGTLQSMSLYLANRDTEFILFKPVRVGGGSSRL